MCSDLSAIHGIRDANQLDSAVFFTLAVRLPTYHGAVAASIAALAQETTPTATPTRAGVPQAAGRPGIEGDVRDRFAAAQAMPVASAAELAALTARASAPGQPAGSVVQVPASS